MNDTPHPPQLTAKDIDARFVALEQLLKARQSNLQTGEEIDLDGLDEQVAQLCHAIASMPVSDAQTYIERLEALLSALSGLQELLVSKHGSLHTQIEGLNRQKQAARAYMAAGHLSKDKKPTDEA